MADVTDQDQAAQRQRVEDGVWRQSAERSFTLWSDAPSGTKERHLLSGPALVWVEGHMMTHPEEYSASYRRFISRSVARRTEEMARGRATTDENDKRTDFRVKLMFATAAMLAVLHVYSGQLRATLEDFINGPDKRRHTAIAVKVRTPTHKNAPAARPDGATQIAGKDQGLSPAGPSPRPAAGQAATRQHRLPPTDLDRRAEQERQTRLANRTALLAHEKVDAGDTRIALHLAIEAVRDSQSIAKMAVVPVEPLLGVHALSAVYRALGTSLPPASPGTPPAPEAGALACGSRFVTADQDDVLRILDPATGSSLPTRGRSAGRWQPLAIDHRCGLAAMLAEDFAVEIVPLTGDAGRPGVKLHGHAADVLAVAFSPDSRLIATASQDASIGLWDASSGRRVRLIAEHDGAVTGVRFDRTATRLLSWSADKTARLWSLAGASLVALPHQGAVVHADFSSDGERIITTSLDGHVRVWSAAGGRLEAQFAPARSSFILARLSEDGRIAVAATQDGEIEIWNVATRTRIAASAASTEGVRELAISPDGQWLVATSFTGRLRLQSTGPDGAAVSLTHTGQKILAARFLPEAKAIHGIAATGHIYRWPLYPSHESAVAEAEQLAGPCLSAAERDALGLSSASPRWCASQQAAAPSTPTATP